MHIFCLAVMLILHLIDMLNDFVEIFERWRLYNVVVSIPELDGLDSVMQIVWKSITAQEYSISNLNISWCDYQGLLIVTKVIQETYLFMGTDNPKTSLTLPLDISPTLIIIFMMLRLMHLNRG